MNNLLKKTKKFSNIQGSLAENCTNQLNCTGFKSYYDNNFLQAAVNYKIIPVFYAYIIAYEANNLWGLYDCNYNIEPSLCQQGAQFIRDNTGRILERYANYSSNVAKFIGTYGNAIFLIEPDFWQYYGRNATNTPGPQNGPQEGGALSGNEMRNLFDQIVATIKIYLPYAAISWDISPWLTPEDMKAWWGYFADSSDIDFIHTSGGTNNGNL